MSNAKLFLLVGGLIAGLCLLILLFVGAIAGIVFYSIEHSAATQAAENFLRHNETLKQDIGEVREFGWFISGQINAQGTDGVAGLRLKAIGTRRSAWTTVRLVYRNGGDWRVVGAWYVNAEGRTVPLLDPYTFESSAPSQEAVYSGTSDASFASDVLQSPEPVLVRFTQVNAGDSAGAFMRLATKYAGRVRFFELYIESNEATRRRYNVSIVPTYILFKDGAEQGRLAGARSEQDLSRLLDRQLQR
ncbi:MAG: hypothetical protein DMF64_20360 [Acidobacteria bacterium]|nr:MAG: hypothetical protein DMF64_20360 [Acidobacteriota bacterium]